MSIKDLFEKPVSIENASTSSIKVESDGFVLEAKKRNETFQPFMDFSSASNFAKFGSAYEYYTEAIERVYKYYPYDGSEKEKIQFEISSSYLDKYVFDKKYPKSTGYINFSYGGWGTGTPDPQGYGNLASSADREYIYIRGGLHTASAGMEGSPLYKTFENSVLYDETKLRTKSFVLDVTKGWTIEFWLKKEDFDTSKSEREVILDLWNNNSTAGSDYGRLTLSLNGGPALNGLNSFNLTVRSGSLASGKGMFEQTICSSTFHTSSLSTWGHYALSVVSESSGLITRFYVNGDLNQKTTHNVGGTMGNIDGRINGYIGSLIATTSHLSPSNQYAGKLSASLDDFRFWKTRRTSEEIYDNWKIQARGGTNTDDANVELGLYYKFNEGVVGDDDTDSTVLDYSGRIINGSWTGYSAGSRNTGSAFISSSLVTKEHEDPIIYSAHPDVKYVLSQMQASGSLWDDVNPTMLYNTVPEWIRNEDSESNSNVKYLYQIMASYFDTLYAQIKAVPTLQNNAYPSASYKALPFAKKLLESRGFMTRNIFIESDLLELFGERDSNQILFQEKLQEVKNIIYTNLYNNLNFIYKSKGTEKSIRNALRCFGIDDEIIKLNVYTDGGTHYFNDNFKQSSLNKKYINFNSSSLFNGTVVLTSSATNANNFITGSAYAKNERFSAFTAEVDIVVPHKLERGEKGHFDTSFLSSSIFGMHRPKEASNGHTWSPRIDDIGNFQVYLARRTKESEDAYFVLRNRSKTINVTSSTFTNIYNNQRWNLAVRVKPDKYPFIGNVVTSSNPTYTIELYGVTHDYDDVRHEFTISSDMSYASGSSFLSDPKGFYLGAHRENFTGSLGEQSDIMAGGFRYYLDYLDNDIVKQHNLDPTNYGVRKSYQSPTLFSDNLNKQLPSADITAVNFDFSTVTGSDSGGKFIVEDLSSGSTDNVYEWADAIVRREHRGLGFGFPASSKKVVENEYIFSMRKELPEISFTSNNVFIKGDKEENFIKDDDVSDNFYTLEKSMGQIISDEMLNMFSSVKEMNNLIGKASERYRMEYKSLGLLKRLFFERNTGDLDFDRFTQYFKWIDSSISQMISQLYPISVRHSKGISNIIESHMLERSKYDNKFPLLESYHGAESSLKAHAEMNYNWKYGHAPIPDSERDNCLWNKDRKERTDIVQRETVRKSILNWNNATAISASTVTGDLYELPTYHIRELAKPYAFSHKFVRQVHGGINYPYNKDRDHMFNAIMRHGKKTSIGAPINVVIVGQGQGLGLVQPQKCDDVYHPNKKDRLNVTVAVGKYSGGGYNAYPINDSEAYTFRTDMSKMPFTMISQSINTGGYLAKVSASYDSGVIITNLHSDTTDFTNEVPMQGPFPEAWVGGHQVRHVDINRRDTTLRDDDVGGAPPNNLHNQYTRPEAWRFLFGERDASGTPTGVGAFGFAGFDYGGPYPDPARKPAIFYRGLRAKRPFNLKNIKTTTGSIKHGNYYENYELMSVGGKHRNNLYFRKNPQISNYLPYSIASTLPMTTHPMTLIGYAPLANGNVFGTHSNNMQPDTDPVVGATASAQFYAYGTSGSNAYSLVNNYFTQDDMGITVDAPIGINIGVSASNSYSFGALTFVEPTGSSVDYWDSLDSKLNAVSSIQSSYSIVNPVNNYSQGLDCASINGQNAALSSSIFVGASSSLAMTFSSWINIRTGSTGHTKNLFYVANSKGGQRSVVIDINAAGHLTCTRYGFNGAFSSNSTATINDFQSTYSGSWIHFACTVGTAHTSFGNTTFYVNGVSQSLSSEAKASGGTAHVLSGTVFVMSNGHQADSNYFPFQGKFDEISYWKSALSDAQIKTLYNCGTRFNLTASRAEDYLPTPNHVSGTLVSWWSFDDSSITGSLHTGLTVTDHAAAFGANTLTVRDKYQEAGSGVIYRPMSGTLNAKPMALFTLQALENGAAYNVNATTYPGVAGFELGGAPTLNNGKTYVYTNCTSSFSGNVSFAGGISDVSAIKNVHTLNDTLLGGSKNKSAITSRFSAPGGPEIQTKGYLDTYSHEYSIHNALPYRNLTVRSSGSGESGTIRAIDIHGNRSGLLTHLRRHSGKFGSDSALGSITSEAYVSVPSFHKIHRNVMRKPTSESQLSSPVFNEDHNNGFFQSPIPQSDYQYSWVTASLNSSYGISSGKQRIYGYAPRDGELVDVEADQSVNFSAANSYINIGTDSTWNSIVGVASPNATMACAFWFKRTRESISHNQRILSFSHRDLMISLESDKLKLESNWGTTDGVWYSKSTFELDRWYHIVLVYDGQSALNDMVLYINGGLADVNETSTPSGGLLAISGQDCYIGNNYSETEAFRGHLDNFAIFNNTISAANAAALYNNGDRFREYTYKTDMVLYYRMGVGGYKGLTRFRDDTTSNFYDISGNSRDSIDAANLSFTTLHSYTVYSAINFPTASEIFGE